MAEDNLIQVIERLFSLPRTRIKPGGHQEDMFLSLPENWREKWECSICYLVLKDPRQCRNGHTYCWCCIHVWSVSGLGENHARCPVCRVKGFYIRNTEINDAILNLTVKCLSTNCIWAGFLKDQRRHNHILKEGFVDRNLSQITDKGRNGQLRSVTATGLPLPQRRYALSLNGSLPNQDHFGNAAPSSTSLPDITSPAGIRTSPSYARYNLFPSQRQSDMNLGRDIFRNSSDVRDVRQRLDDSRNRLQAVLSAFDQRLTQNEEETVAFQEERERRRQEQLDEVQRIEIRLGEVATRSRSWFNQDGEQPQE